MNQAKTRIASFDLLKCLAIFLVIWGHSIGSLTKVDGNSDCVYRIIYSFHMPLFMMMSGYFAASSMNSAPWPFIKKKFTQLIFPCIFWGGLCWFFLECKHSFHYGNQEFSIVGLISDFYWLSDFWFLKSCFICYCLAYIGSHLKIKRTYWILLTIAISQFIPPFFVSFMYPCFVIGMEMKYNNDLYTKILSYRYYIMCVFLLMLLFWNNDMWLNSHGIPSGILNENFSIWTKIAFARLFRLIIGIVGAIGIISTFTSFFNHKNNKIFMTFQEWGQYTLEVYILQAIILERTISKYFSFNEIEQLPYDFLIAPILSFVLLTLCIFIAKKIKKWSLFRMSS